MQRSICAIFKLPILSRSLWYRLIPSCTLLWPCIARIFEDCLSIASGNHSGAKNSGRLVVSFPSGCLKPNAHTIVPHGNYASPFCAEAFTSQIPPYHLEASPSLIALTPAPQSIMSAHNTLRYLFVEVETGTASRSGRERIKIRRKPDLAARSLLLRSGILWEVPRLRGRYCILLRSLPMSLCATD